MFAKWHVSKTFAWEDNTFRTKGQKYALNES